MPINKAALLSVIDASLEGHAKAQLEHDAKVAEWQLQRRAKWDRENAPKLHSLRDMLTTKLKAGQAITKDDIGKALGVDRWGTPRDASDLAWYPSRDPGRDEVKPVPHLDVRMFKELKAALAVIEGDTISPSALSQWGFRNLGPLFKAAAQLSTQ